MTVVYSDVKIAFDKVPNWAKIQGYGIKGNLRC